MRILLRYGVAALVAMLPAPMPMAADLAGATERQAIMRLIVRNWLETQRRDGFLPYGFDFLADRATDNPLSGGFIIREAAAMYTWASYHRYAPDARFEDPLRKGIDALAQRSIAIGKSRAQTWVEWTRVLSMPFGRLTLTSALDELGLLYQPTGSGRLVSADGFHNGAFAGATAFALLSELIYSQVTGDNRYAGLRSAWLEGLLALRIPGAGFREIPTSIDASDYSDAQAWLALAVYADIHPGDGRVGSALDDVDRALMRQYSGRPSNAFYTAGTIAAARRWKTTRDPRFVEFLREQTGIFLTRYERRFDPDLNNCPAMEGLAATLGVLQTLGQADTPAALKIRDTLLRDANQLPLLQIRPGETRLTMGGSAYVYAPHLAQFGGAFRWGRYEAVTRVDAAVHCLSALTMIEDMGLLRPGR